MPRVRIPCFSCRTPLLFDEHDLSFTCPQCGLRYLVENQEGVVALATSGEGSTPAVVVSEAKAEPAVVEAPAALVTEAPPEPAVVAPPADSVVMASRPAGRGPLIATAVTIGMAFGLCGGILGGLGLGAVIYATFLRPG
jgi:DNA-directed RNA polymerase subunit RPC12/RpoP